MEELGGGVQDEARAVILAARTRFTPHLQLDDGNCGEKEGDADDVAVIQIQSVRIIGVDVRDVGGYTMHVAKKTNVSTD